MIMEFCYSNLAVFYTDITDVERSIIDLFRKDLNKFSFNRFNSFDDFDLSEFLTPHAGGAHLPKLVIWQNVQNPNTTFFMSNYEDGLANLTKLISRSLKIDLVNLLFLTNREHPKLMFRKCSANGDLRYVHLIKDNKWEFYEEGSPLPYEKLDVYNSKKVRDRLSESLILEYFREEGFLLNDILSEITSVYVMTRNEW